MSALEAELKRLRAENEALKKRIDDPCGTGHHVWGRRSTMRSMDGDVTDFQDCLKCGQRSFF